MTLLISTLLSGAYRATREGASVLGGSNAPDIMYTWQRHTLQVVGTPGSLHSHHQLESVALSVVIHVVKNYPAFP